MPTGRRTRAAPNARVFDFIAGSPAHFAVLPTSALVKTSPPPKLPAWLVTAHGFIASISTASARCASSVAPLGWKNESWMSRPHVGEVCPSTESQSR
jgi:hypothetical protein